MRIFWPLACRVCHFCKYANAYCAAIYRLALVVILFVRNGVSTSWFNKISKVTKRALAKCQRREGGPLSRGSFDILLFSQLHPTHHQLFSPSPFIYSLVLDIVASPKSFRHGTKVLLSNPRRNFLSAWISFFPQHVAESNDTCCASREFADIKPFFQPHNKTCRLNLSLVKIKQLKKNVTD